MSEKIEYTDLPHKERETKKPSDLSEFNPAVVELVRFLAKKAAESDYQELLNSLQTIQSDKDEE